MQKKNRRYSNKLVWAYERNKGKIEIALLISILILSFVIGYYGSSIWIAKTLSEDQVQFCMKVAIKVYENDQDYLECLSDDIMVEKSQDGSNVVVKIREHLGKIVAKVEGNAISTTYDSELGIAICINSVIGIACFSIMLLMMAIWIYSKEQEEDFDIPDEFEDVN